MTNPLPPPISNTAPAGGNRLSTVLMQRLRCRNQKEYCSTSKHQELALSGYETPEWLLANQTPGSRISRLVLIASIWIIDAVPHPNVHITRYCRLTYQSQSLTGMTSVSMTVDPRAASLLTTGSSIMRVVPSERCSVSVRTSANSPLRWVKTIARSESTGQP